MLGDLHCHTRLSDGSSTIDDLVFYAKRGGLDFVAITDHDTMAGVTRATVLGKRYGIKVVPGVELSAYDTARKRSVHILCYLPQKPDRLLGICTKVTQSRTRAGQEMLNRAMRYYPITPEHVSRYYSGSKALYKVHIMNAIMDLGYTNTIHGPLYHELFDSWSGSCYVEVTYPDVRHVIDVIHSAGGLAVMAHPPEYDSFDLLEELCSKGLLEGVEYSHPRCGPEDKKRIAELADHYGLIKTGGTDFHGYYASDPHPLGSFVTQPEEIDKMYKMVKK